MICSRCGQNFNQQNTWPKLILYHYEGRKWSYGNEGGHIGFGTYPMPASQAFSSVSMEPIYVQYNFCPSCQKELEEWFAKKGSDP